MKTPAALLVFAAVGVTTASCTTTTSGRPGSPAASGWLARHASSGVRVVGDEDGEMEVVIEATSPTELHFRSRDAGPVPIEKVRKAIDVRRGLGALEGAGLGAGAGVLLGMAYGLTRSLNPYEQSMDCTIVCNHDDAAKLYGAMFGVLGLLVGAATGAIIGDRNVLDLR